MIHFLTGFFLFWYHIGVGKSLVGVKCYTGCIYYTSLISDVVFMSMIDGHFLLFLNKFLKNLIPKLMRRYLNQAFIFLRRYSVRETIQWTEGNLFLLTIGIWQWKSNGQTKRFLATNKEESVNVHIHILWYVV